MRASLLAITVGIAIASAGPAARAQQQPLARPDVERIVREYLLQNPG
jgi:hypothetical protein